MVCTEYLFLKKKNVLAKALRLLESVTDLCHCLRVFFLFFDEEGGEEFFLSLPFPNLNLLKSFRIS